MDQPHQQAEDAALHVRHRRYPHIGSLRRSPRRKDRDGQQVCGPARGLGQDHRGKHHRILPDGHRIGQQQVGQRIRRDDLGRAGGRGLARIAQPVLELRVGDVQVGREFGHLAVGTGAGGQIHLHPVGVQPDPARPRDQRVAGGAKALTDLSQQLAQAGIAVIGVAVAEQQVLQPRPRDAQTPGRAQYRQHPPGPHAPRRQTVVARAGHLDRTDQVQGQTVHGVVPKGDLQKVIQSRLRVID